MYQTPLTPEGEDEYVYNYLTEKQLGDEIQVGCPGLRPLIQRRWCDIGVAIETKWRHKVSDLVPPKKFNRPNETEYSKLEDDLLYRLIFFLVLPGVGNGFENKYIYCMQNLHCK